MNGLELRISDIVNDRSANWAKTIAQLWFMSYLLDKKITLCLTIAIEILIAIVESL